MHFRNLNSITNFIQTAKYLIYNVLKNWIAYTVESPVTNKGFMIVDNKNSVPRYKNLYLDTNEVSIRRKLTFRRSSVIKKSLSRFGMVVLPANMPQNNIEALSVPNFVDLTVKLPIDIDTHYRSLSKSARDDIRRIKNKGYTSSVSKDADWINTFHSDYYKPSMQGRHGDEAYVMPFGQMNNLMRSGKLEFLNIYADGICIASLLREIKNEKYHFFKMGWLNGDHTHVKAGAIAAIYWFGVREALDRQCNEIVLGGTPAYLESGVFKYKTKWRANFPQLHNFYGLNQLMLNPNHPDCYQFLKQVSLIAIGKQNRLIVLSSKRRDKADVNRLVLNDFSRWYVLRDQKSDSYNKDVEELPLSLRYWYERSIG